jgi:hypothetical protein
VFIAYNAGNIYVYLYDINKLWWVLDMNGVWRELTEGKPKLDLKPY